MWNSDPNLNFTRLLDLTAGVSREAAVLREVHSESILRIHCPHACTSIWFICGARLDCSAHTAHQLRSRPGSASKFKDSWTADSSNGTACFTASPMVFLALPTVVSLPQWRISLKTAHQRRNQEQTRPVKNISCWKMALPFIHWLLPCGQLLHLSNSCPPSG